MKTKTPGLWVSPTQFVQFGEAAAKNARPLMGQIATRAQSSYGLYSLGTMLPNPDTVLKKVGKDIAIYRELRTEAQVGGNIRRRKGAVKALEWGIDKGKAKSRSARLIEDVFAGLERDRIVSEILDATLYGYQPMEVIWGQVGPYWLPVDIVGKPPEWFFFDPENNLRMRTRDRPMEGVEVPPYKILLPRQEATYDNPYGFPDLSMCYWPTTFKKGGLKFWVTFAEKYGSPWLVGKHPRNTEISETEALLDSLSAMYQDAVAVIPDDSSVEIVESSGKGASADVYERLLMFCRSEVNYALLGQNQTSEASSTRASAQAGLEVTHDIRDGDAAIVCDTFNTLIKWIWFYNFNDDNRPRFDMWEQEEVNKSLAERDEKLTRAGARLTPAYFKRAYALQDGDVEDALPATATVPALANDNAAAFAEGVAPSFPDQTALDTALASLDGTAQQAQATAMLAPVIKLITDATDYPAALEKLATLYPTMDTTALQDALTRAQFAAELWGQANGDA